MARWHKVLPVMMAAGVLIDRAVLRPFWYLHWGATEDERRKQWPGDELVARPGYATRAITIHAAAEAVWPWILQIGQDRGGFYSYTWLENLALADIRNADRIFPEFQPRSIGDVVRMAPQHRYGGKACMAIAQLVPNRAMVLVQPDELGAAMRGERLQGGIWQFLLEPMDSNSTRLIMRGAAPDKTSLLYDLIFDPAHFVMERKMMLGIQQRVEREARSRTAAEGSEKA